PRPRRRCLTGVWLSALDARRNNPRGRLTRPVRGRSPPTVVHGQLSDDYQLPAWGAVLSCIPPSRFTLRLDHVCPAQPWSQAAFGNAFRSLHRGHEPAPRPGWFDRPGCRTEPAKAYERWTE